MFLVFNLHSCWISTRLNYKPAVVAVSVGGCGGLTFELLWHHAGVVLEQIPWRTKRQRELAR